MKNSMKDFVELRVARNTQPGKLGGAIVKYLKEVPTVRLAAMGEASVNVAVKSTIVAQSFLAYEAKDIVIKLGFDTRYDDTLDKEVTVVMFYLCKESR